ncbi:MAG: hypothetical protein PSV22_23860 [Pseudolabrys sp.]|nr:hypothetical protein [Pseudolabrys sp.]
MQEIETAYHEAGHAFMGCLIDRLPISVTIVARGQITGETFFEPDVPKFARRVLDPSPEKRRYAEQRVLTELADTAAHDLLCPGRIHDSGDENDLAITNELIKELVSWADNRDEYLRDCQTRAVKLLQQNWPWVEAVAKALLEKKTLQREIILSLRTNLLAE